MNRDHAQMWGLSLMGLCLMGLCPMGLCPMGLCLMGLCSIVEFQLNKSLQIAIHT